MIGHVFAQVKIKKGTLLATLRSFVKDDSFEKFSLVNFSNLSILQNPSQLLTFKALLDFFSVYLPLFGIFLLWYLDYHFKFSFDLKAILFFAKDNFIQR